MTEKAQLEVVTVNKDKKEDVKFFPSGSTLLDLVLGGGWACSRVFNLVGDFGSGKTLLAIEAFINFKRTFPSCKMRYVEPEARFNEELASLIGFPEEVERPEDPIETVEDFLFDLNQFINKNKKGEENLPRLYILDSLDSLSSQEELELQQEVKKLGDKRGSSYGTAKAKGMSAMFRIMARDIERSNCTLGIISQLRDNIGATYGESSIRSGGRALNFASSQIVWLREIGKITHTAYGETRATGVQVGCKNKKNSCGMPFREAEFEILFQYGVDQAVSMLKWLKSREAYPKETYEETDKRLQQARKNQDYTVMDEIETILREDTITHWNKIEDKLKKDTQIRKYR